MKKLIKRKMGLAGRWLSLEAFKQDAEGNEIAGTRRRLAGDFRNLITDAGLDHFGTTSSSYMIECRVGEGNTAPANGDTALVSEVATTTNVLSSNATAQPSPPYYISRINVYRFAAGAAEGNLAEIGVGPNAGGDLFSRALILDGGGSPTTITVLSDEVLDATYELRLYPDTDDVTGTRTISGDDYDYVVRVAEVTSASIYWANGQSGISVGSDRMIVYNGAIGAVTASPGGTENDQTFSGTAQGYTPGSYQRDVVYDLSLIQGNLTGGISAALALFGGVGAIQCSFDPALPKTGSDLLSLTFRLSWGRATI